MKGVQTRFAVDVEEPWKGICCEACWNAQGERCRCRCGGLYHGLGRQGARTTTHDQMLPAEAAEKILALIGDKCCRWCGADLPSTVYGYPHSEGWEVEGYEERLWLYMLCTKCGYQWALWKLGVSRFARF